MLLVSFSRAANGEDNSRALKRVGRIVSVATLLKWLTYSSHMWLGDRIFSIACLLSAVGRGLWYVIWFLRVWTIAPSRLKLAHSIGCTLLYKQLVALWNLSQYHSACCKWARQHEYSTLKICNSPYRYWCWGSCTVYSLYTAKRHPNRSR